MSEYCLYREDPKDVLFYPMIPLLPICHQVSVRLKLPDRMPLQGYERIAFVSRRSQRRAVLSSDPVTAHFPSGVSETEIPYLYALAEDMSEYYLYREDPKDVLYYHMIPLLPIFHLVSVRLNLQHLYALQSV